MRVDPDYAAAGLLAVGIPSMLLAVALAFLIVAKEHLAALGIAIVLSLVAIFCFGVTIRLRPSFKWCCLILGILPAVFALGECLLRLTSGFLDFIGL